MLEKKTHLVTEETADVALLGGAEGVEGVGVALLCRGSNVSRLLRRKRSGTDLGAVVGLANPVVQDDEDTATSRVGVSGDRDGLEEVVGSARASSSQYVSCGTQ